MLCSWGCCKSESPTREYLSKACSVWHIDVCSLGYLVTALCLRVGHGMECPLMAKCAAYVAVQVLSSLYQMECARAVVWVRPPFKIL